MVDGAYVERMARYNRWQNENLHSAADRLSETERRRVREPLGLDPQDVQSPLVGRSDVDELAHWFSAVAGRDRGFQIALCGLDGVEGRTGPFRSNDHRLGGHHRAVMACGGNDLLFSCSPTR